MSAETKKEVLVEYPIDIVYDTLIFLFPVKYFKLDDNDDYSYTVSVYDSSNRFFTMFIKLVKKAPNITSINFFADYPHAAADLTHGGEKAINTVLEELLKELDKNPKSETNEDKEYKQNTNVKIVNFHNFVNPTKNEKNTKTIIAGYVACILSIVLPAYSFIKYESGNLLLGILFVIGVICFTFLIIIATILQYSDNQNSIMHGRIQTVICCLLFILGGYFIHPSLAFGGIIITAVILGYFFIRDRSISQK